MNQIPRSAAAMITAHLTNLVPEFTDHYAKQAMDIVKASRGGEQGENAGKPRGKAADPHIHTLLRFVSIMLQVLCWQRT